MKRTLLHLLAFLFIALAPSLSLHSDQQAVPRPPEICDLSVQREDQSGDVIITWSGGTPPFSIARADAQCFGKASEIRHLVENVKDHRYVDVAAARSGDRFWYQVFDDNSPMEIWYIGPADADNSDPNVTHPTGDGDCGNLDTCHGNPREPCTWK